MTFGSLMGWGGYGKTPALSPIERYHSGSGSYWDHKSHGHGHKSGGKGGFGSAALSALTLLAFLFLMNVMQQSLQANNSTMATGTGTTAVLLREEPQSGSRNLAEVDKDRSTNYHTLLSSSGDRKNFKKGDTL